MCWFCKCNHTWRVVSVDHYIDASYGDKVRSFKAVSRCTKCGEIKVPKWGNYGGGWPSVKQLNGEE